MADSSLRNIGITMAVSFAVSVAVMAWQRRPAHLPAAAAGLTAEVGSPAHIDDPRPMSQSEVAAVPDRAPKSTGPIVAPASVAESAAAVADAGPVAPGEELPIVIHVRNRRDINEIDGDIRNISSRPLDVTLRAENDRNQPTSEIHLQLAPGEHKPFGQSDGLMMQAEDRLVAESWPYGNRTTRIP